MISTFAARARQGGVALARPFDGSNLDLTAGTKTALTALSQTATTRLTMGSTKTSDPAYVGNALAGKLIRFASMGGGYQVGLYPNGAQLNNIDSDVGIYNVGTSSATESGIADSRVSTDINAQYLGGAITAAIDAGGLVKNCDLRGTSEDGIYPGYDNAKNDTPGQWSVYEGNNVLGPGAFNFYLGFPYGGPFPWDGSTVTNTGLLLTRAQINAATPWTAGMTVTSGEFVSVTTKAAGPMMYLVLNAGGAPGTIGTEDATGQTGSDPWATASATWWMNGGTPFTSGTATIAPVGEGIHSDAYQTTGRQCVAIRLGFAGDFANSCIIIQNTGKSTVGGVSTPYVTPVMNWVVESGVMRAAGTYAFYVQSQIYDDGTFPEQVDPYPYAGLGGTASHNQPGGFSRVSAGDWIPNPVPGYSRPWHIRFRDLTIETPLSGPHAGTTANMGTCISAEGVVFLDGIPRQNVLLGSQFGWDSGDTRIAMMQAGTYDYVRLGFPPPDSTVMEARLQEAISVMGTSSAFSATPGALDARCMPVWELNIRDANGHLIHPASGTVPVPANTAITDSTGRYIGN